MLAGPVSAQLATVQDHYAGATATPLPGNAFLISIPGVKLPAGWSKAETTLYFIAPTGYPAARPDCFWTDGDLRLASGGLPQNTGLNAGAPQLVDKLWFSYHPTTWNGAHDSLATFINVIRQRLLDAR